MSLKKRGYFFVLDALIAILILGVGFVLISSARPEKTPYIQSKHLSQDLMNVLSQTKINDLCENP
ncbi:hypothetical protein GF327_05605, partial [Candidatus Woesearchaeota archaeon]|nr:hypothetical protein [Candidatus Woesearchaeota archaeon]